MCPPRCRGVPTPLPWRAHPAAVACRQNEVEELKRALFATERSAASAREQMEGVSHAAAAELRECQSRAESRLSESRSRTVALEEDLANMTRKGTELRREAEEVAKLAEKKLQAERKAHADTLEEAEARRAADVALAEEKAADCEMRASQVRGLSNGRRPQNERPGGGRPQSERPGGWRPM